MSAHILRDQASKSQCLVKEIKLLHNELRKCEERPQEPKECRVCVVHKVALEMLSNLHHEECLQRFNRTPREPAATKPPPAPEA